VAFVGQTQTRVSPNDAAYANGVQRHDAPQRIGDSERQFNPARPSRLA
jgi:hypothetical protein